MAVIAAPSPVQPTPHSGTAYEDFTGPSANQRSQPSRGSFNRPQRGATTTGELSSPPNGHNRRSNGSQAIDMAGTQPNRESQEQQALSRSRTADNEALAHRLKPQLTRRKTDYDRDHQSTSATEEAGELRHGWEDQYNSSEFLGLLSSVCTHSLAAR